MNLAAPIVAELEQEAVTTRRVLERVPLEHFDFRPHPRSMPAGRLASHIAELPSWGVETLTTDEMVFDPASFKPWVATSKTELLDAFERNVTAFKSALGAQTEASLMQPWRARTPERVIFEQPRLVVLRSMVLNHIVHHRGQLAVFLRLMDVPVPSIYGPSADERAS